MNCYVASFCVLLNFLEPGSLLKQGVSKKGPLVGGIVGVMAVGEDGMTTMSIFVHPFILLWPHSPYNGHFRGLLFGRASRVNSNSPNFLRSPPPFHKQHPIVYPQYVHHRGTRVSDIKVQHWQLFWSPTKRHKNMLSCVWGKSLIPSLSDGPAGLLRWSQSTCPLNERQLRAFVCNFQLLKTTNW